MRASSRLLGPGFTQRSLDELKRFTRIGTPSLDLIDIHVLPLECVPQLMLLTVQP